MAKGRSKLGGIKTLTRNQGRKAQRSGQQADRLRTVTQWADEWEKRKTDPKVKAEEKANRKKKPNMTGYAVKRRSVALVARLEQLETGTKVLSTKALVKLPYEEYQALLEAMPVAESDIIIPLSPQDRKRIEKEIEVLKSRGAVVPKPVMTL